MRGSLGVLQVVREVEGEDVDGEDPGAPRPQRRQGFLVRVVSMGGQYDEGVHPRLLPGAEQVVHPPM